jgi:copper ion binding protein
MSCASCVSRVEKALRQLTGVIDVSVNLATEQATLKTTPEVQLETLVEVVRNAGYDVARQIVELQIDGMNCASCVGRVEKALLKLTEVLNASVNLATEKVTIETLSGVSFALLAAAIAKAGYTARDKANIVQELRSQGYIVAMVGDGLNDAPSLVAADVGLSMSTGTDVAMEAAGITLMRGDPRLVADSFDVSRRTYSKIKQGLFWALAQRAGHPTRCSWYAEPSHCRCGDGLSR